MRRASTSIAIAVALASVPTAAAAQEGPRDEPPNILIILTDDQRSGSYSTMPRMKKWFGDGGTRYDRAFASTPLCCPSRASILTGRYAHNHGVKSNGAGETLDHTTTITRYLRDAGYRTGYFGKYINYWPFEEPPPYFARYALLSGSGGYYDARWNVDGVTQRIETYSTNFVQFKTEEFIAESEQNDGEPWFAVAAPFAPHAPFVAEERYRDLEVRRWGGNPAVREEALEDKPPWLRDGRCRLGCGRKKRARQLRMLASVDDLVAGIRRELRQNDESNTLAIYMSDNGMMWGEHGLKGKSQPYLQSSQIPLFVRWRDRVPRGVVSDDLALNIDVAATVLDAAGVSPPPEAPPLDGRSLLDATPRDRVLLEHWCTRRGCDDWAATTTSTYQYVERRDATGAVTFAEYYDLIEDRWQLQNVLFDDVVGNEPADVAALSEQLAADRTCAGTTCP